MNDDLLLCPIRRSPISPRIPIHRIVIVCWDGVSTHGASPHWKVKRPPIIRFINNRHLLFHPVHHPEMRTRLGPDKTLLTVQNFPIERLLVVRIADVGVSGNRDDEPATWPEERE